MSKEYREYNPRRTTSAKKRNPASRFGKKLLKQLVFSVIIFSVICGFKLYSSSKINEYIQSAFLYQPDTSFITNTIKSVFNHTNEQNQKEGSTNEEITEEKAPETL